MSSGIHFPGELAAVLTTVSWAICVFPFTASAKVLGASTLNHLRLIMAVVLLYIMALIATGNGPLFFLSANPASWLWLGASGIIGLGLGDYFAFRSFIILGPRKATLFSTLSPGAALLAGILLLGESLNLIGFAGMVITLAGVATVAVERSSGNDQEDRKKRWPGILFAILSAFSQGLGLALAKCGFNAAAKDLNPVQAAWMRMMAALVILYVVTIILGRWKTVHAPLRHNGRAIFQGFLGTIFGPVVGVSLSMAAAASIHVSVAQTIFSLVPVVVMLIAFGAGQEKPGWRAVLAALVAVGGVMLLVWRDSIGRMLIGE